MNFVNPIGFRLGNLHSWKYKNTLVYTNKSFYSASLKELFFVPIYLKRLFDRRFFRRFDYYFSHLVVNKQNNGASIYTLFLGSRFLRGVFNWFYKDFLVKLNRLILRKRLYKALSTSFVRRSRTNSFNLLRFLGYFIYHKVYSKLYQITRLISNFLTRAVLNFNSNLRGTDKLVIFVRVLDDLAPTASSLGSFFLNRLKRGGSINRLVRSTFQIWSRNGYKRVAGLRIVCEGRFKRRQRAQHDVYSIGRVRASTALAKVDYALSTVYLKYGAGSVRIWLNYK